MHHWTDAPVGFTTTRDQALRFSNGHFTMIGLEEGGKKLLRAYSIVSPNYEDHLEFLSIKVPGGPLTSKLQHIKPGDTIIVGRKPTGTLLIDYLLPGKRLYLLATGTGLAPFMSVVRDPETHERFEQVILVHSVREVDELAYHDYLVKHLPSHEFLGDLVTSKLRYYPTVTREEFVNMGRITELVESGKLFADLGVPGVDAANDRVMCRPAMLRDLKHMLARLRGQHVDPRGLRHRARVRRSQPRWRTLRACQSRYLSAPARESGRGPYGAANAPRRPRATASAAIKVRARRLRAAAGSRSRRRPGRTTG